MRRKKRNERDERVRDVERREELMKEVGGREVGRRGE